MIRARVAPASLPPAYPHHAAQTLTLADGRVLFVRPVVPEDAPVLLAEIEAADPETLYHRFFTPVVKLGSDKLRHLTVVDYQSNLALVAISGDGDGVAVVRYAQVPERDGEAEVAFAVKPDWRHAGVASSLYRLLEDLAVSNGMEVLHAAYLADNDAAAGLLERLGFSSPIVEGGVAEVHKSLGQDGRAPHSPQP